MSFKEQLREMAELINFRLNTFVPLQDNRQQNIYEAMRYSLLAGGKRIRPVLTLAFADILGVDREVVMPFACALEMIHTYSLIHDDLPAMDNDDLRRGRPTCHKQFDEATAILAGDALLNKAFEVMSMACHTMPDDMKSRGIDMLGQVAIASGTEGMIGGQVIDLESEGKDVDEETILEMYRCKTGALLNAPACIAVSAAGMEKSEDAKHIFSYTSAIGLAFQIKDDILDIEGNTEVMGKAVGRDAKQDKRALTAVAGVEKCKKMLEELTDRAISDAEYFGEKGNFIKDMAEYLLKRDN